MNWTVLKKPKTDEKKLKAEEIVEILLQNRGLKTKKQIEEFLDPVSPFDFTPKQLGISPKELTKAVKRIKKAIESKEEMIVWGDYDVDGLTGTAILWEVIYNLGGKIMPYIPDRITEGYGLNKKSLKKLKVKSEKLKVIVTVDHGIVASKEIEYAQKQGIDVILTDHHQLGKVKPKAHAIVHTTKICGAAVAWVLARELLKKVSDIKSNTSQEAMRPPPRWGGKIQDFLDLAAMGTIADMVPLVGANRSFVKFGLKQLNKTKRAGLLALFKNASLKKGEIGPYEVGWMIGPRLNASGRVGNGMDSLRLLCVRDEERARNLALTLNRINKERQDLLTKNFLHAQKQVVSLEKEKLIFISDALYHEGVIGLVAGKLMRQFYRPSIVVAEGKIYSKASARSINGFNIVEAIRKCGQDLVNVGGHPMAAGFTVKTKKLKAVGKKLTAIANEKLNEKTLTKSLKVDLEVSLQDLSFKLCEAIEKLLPFGMGNPEPVFVSRGLKVVSARLVGKNQDHLKLVLDDPKTPKIERTGAEAKQTPLDGIAFGLGEVYSQLSKDKLIDVAYNFSVNVWNGEKKLQLRIKDIKIRD